MITVKTLPIRKEGLRKQPDKFEINIDGKVLIFEIMWNSKGNFFTCNIYDRSGNSFILGRKMVLGFDLLGRINNDEIPEVYIVPLPLTGNAQNSGITWANFGSDVKVYILDKGGE